MLLALSVVAGARVASAGALVPPLARSTLQHALRDHGTRTMQQLMSRLAKLERVHGNNDERLAPRVLDRADPLLQAVMSEVYGKEGPRELALQEIERRLTDRLGQLALRGRAELVLRPLHDQLVGEAIARLADDYAREVLADKTLNAHEFQRGRSISPSTWKQLQRYAPGKFAIGEARPHGRKLAADELGALAEAWQAEVVSGQILAKDFYPLHGVTEKRMNKLRRDDPERFGPPPQRPPNGNANDAEAIAAIAARVHALYDRDVLMTRESISDALNRDHALVGRYGKMSPSRLNRMFAASPGAFPSLTDVDAKLRVLAAELQPLVQKGLSRGELVDAMKLRHPSFTPSRLVQIEEAHPSLVLDAPKEAAPPATPTTPPGPARKIPLKDPTIRPMGRDSLTVTKLAALALELAPPGATYGDLHRALSKLLVARGIAPFEHEGSIQNLLERAQAGAGTPADVTAAKAAEVVAEYARAARRGATSEEILDAVRRDYPSLSRRVLGDAEKKWMTSPKAFGALARFFRGGKLTLVGQGQRLKAPRFLGGWDIDRAVLRAAGARKESLIRLSAAARVAIRMPLLDEIIRDLDGREPLAQTNLLWVTHLLGTTVPLGLALKKAGASAHQTFVVGSPYGTNEQARDALEHEGFSVRTPSLDIEDYRRQVALALDQAVAKHRINRQPIVVLDDGGLVAEILHGDPKYADILSAVKIVEQTTRGITAAEQLALKVPIIAGASALSKLHEGSFIGRAVAAKVVQGLRRVGKSLDGKTIVLVGYGTVGAPTAAELKAAGAKVIVIERSEERTAEARRDGFVVLSKRAALKKADMVIGATGERSLEVEDLLLLKDGAIVASASSKQVEIDMQGLARRASKRTLLAGSSPLATLPSAVYRLGKRAITMLGDGWPVNFDGDVESVPADEIQLTRAVMLLGAIQARSTRADGAKNHVIVPFDPLVDRQLLARYKALREGQPHPPISDPERWEGIFHEVADAFTAEP